MMNWLPGEADKFFGVDRNPHIPFGQFIIKPDRCVSDTALRSWRERLFTRPWQPWKRIKPEPRAYIVGNTVLVSWRTFQQMNRGEK